MVDGGKAGLIYGAGGAGGDGSDAISPGEDFGGGRRRIQGIRRLWRRLRHRQAGGNGGMAKRPVPTPTTRPTAGLAGDGGASMFGNGGRAERVVTPSARPGRRVRPSRVALAAIRTGRRPATGGDGGNAVAEDGNAVAGGASPGGIVVSGYRQFRGNGGFQHETGRQHNRRELPAMVDRVAPAPSWLVVATAVTAAMPTVEVSSQESVAEPARRFRRSGRLRRRARYRMETRARWNPTPVSRQRSRKSAAAAKQAATPKPAAAVGSGDAPAPAAALSTTAHRRRPGVTRGHQRPLTHDRTTMLPPVRRGIVFYC